MYTRRNKVSPRTNEKKIRPCMGVDGEGFDHGSCYAYMAAADASGAVHGSAERIQTTGLSTTQCLDFLLDLPKGFLVMGFSLGYDYTHWLKDLPNDSLWKLNHIEERQRKNGPPTPIWYLDQKVDGIYTINLISAKLTVCKYEGHLPTCADGGDFLCRGCRLRGRVVIWDSFKFFQSSFINACFAWKVITKDEHEFLKCLKGGRAKFERPKSEMSPKWMEIKKYCQLECAKMAELGDKLVQAHVDAGIPLKQFYGAGSTSSAMLDTMSARMYSRVPIINQATGEVEKKRDGSPRTTPAIGPVEMLGALASSFFGGRFETSWRGPVEQCVWSYDISSAYPYAFTFLPCLVHGTWEHIANWREGGQQKVEEAHAALVRYQLPYTESLGRIQSGGISDLHYGPFPFRVGKGHEFVDEGNIIFPVTSGGGWVHKEEFLAAQAGFPNVVPREAWVYRTDCACTVLRHGVPKNYCQRLLWGKEGKGIVVKLGLNGGYGKCAQTKGANPPYQNFIWAGMTTASCRAQVLRAGRACGWENVIMIATDGIITRTRGRTLGPVKSEVPFAFDLESPRDTGTADALNDKGKPANKPLGGWEEKDIPNGIHVIRPGIAFPLQPAEEFEEKEAKARGFGKAVMHKMRGEVLEHWFLHGHKSMHVYRPMFHGMKSQIRKPNSQSGGLCVRGKRYGRFSDQKVVISYEPMPKRPCAEGQRLLSWALGSEHRSAPYMPVLGESPILSQIVKALKEEKMWEEDQPDVD